MSLDFAILGFLNYTALSGYDLKKLFDTSVRHFWSADQSQIYRTLARLTSQGMVTLELVEQGDRPDRKVYHITPAGKDALRDWLAGPFPTQDNRSAPLVQVFFSGQLSDEEILAKFRWAAAFFRGILDQYEQVPPLIDGHMREIRSPREEFFWLLTLELGQKVMQAQLDWAESVIRRLEQHEAPVAEHETA